MQASSRFCVVIARTTVAKKGGALRKAAVVRSFSLFNPGDTFREHRPSTPYPEGRTRSNAQALISAVPPIEVDGDHAVCDGGSGVLGHPTQYLQLNKGGAAHNQPETCKYCGLSYVKKAGKGGHHHH